MDQLVQFFFKLSPSTFAKGKLALANRPAGMPLWLLLLMAASAIAALVYFLYIRPNYRINTQSRWGLIALRATLLAALAVMLMRPVVVVPSVIPKSTNLAVLADDSRSMELADEGGRKRIDVIKELLAPDKTFSKGLDEKFRVNTYGFAQEAVKIKDANELKAQGGATDLVGALQQAVKDSTGAALSAVVLVSDGGANTPRDLTAELRALRARNIPVFTVGVGDTGKFKDAELSRITTPRRVLTGSAISAEVLVRLAGYDKTKLAISVSEDGRALKTQSFDARASDAQTFTMEYTPTGPGAHRYTFEIKPLDGETTVENNAQDALIEVTNDKPRVLYIEGEPRWEYGKMRFSLLKNEKNLTLVSVLRSADGKFYRQGVESGDQLTQGFPTNDEELFGYQGIVLGSIEANFFSYDQLRFIEQFASKRGGGVMAIGGAHSFDGGKYANTPVGELLPIVLNNRIEEPELLVASDWKAQLTARGRTHAVTRLNEDRNLSAKAWDELPAITVPEAILGIKPGASVILEARSLNDRTRAVPLLVEQRYGRGRTMAFTTNDTWRWRMELPSQNTYHETFWRQLLRYLVSATPNQYEAFAERDVYAVGDNVALRAEINDKKFDVVKDATASVRVTKPSGASVDLPLRINYEQQTVDHRGEFKADEAGLYKVEMTAKRGGAVLSTAQSNFLVSERSREFFAAAQNVELLKRVANETGGKYYPLNKARNLVDEITLLEGKNSERVSKDLWDMPINFMLLVGLASAEWFLRKKRGLA